MRKFLLIILCFLFAGSLFAQTYPVSGTVFNDLNGNTIINSGENFSSLPVQFRTYLVDTSGIIIDSAWAQPDGTYTLDAPPNQTYTIQLSSVQYPIGTNTVTTPINKNLPAGWARTGENGNNNILPSNDNTPNGILEVIVSTSAVGSQNFGIRRVYTISGHVYNDPDAGNINNSAVPFSLPYESLRSVLINAATNTIVDAVNVSYVNGSFTFTGVPPGNYYVMVITPNEALNVGNPVPHPILETGWTRTGESLLVSGAPDASTNGRTETFSVTDSNITGVLFGLQERPFADNKMNVLLDNTSLVPVALSVNISSAFTQGGAAILSGSDNSGGVIVNYTINVLPKYGTLYLAGVPVTTLSQVASLTPVQFATLAYQPNPSALTQEQDMFTYYVADNAGTKSNNATYVIPFPLLDSDGDSYVDRYDHDDDNDGITDIDECPLNNFGNLVTAYFNDEFTFIRPHMFGYSIAQRTGLNITGDLSHYFGYPVGSGAIIVTVSNANTHPTANEFYVNDSTGPSQWTISGTIGSYLALEHGQEYFSYDTRTITLLNGTPKHYLMGQTGVDPADSRWYPGSDGTYSWWLTSDTTLRMSTINPTVMNPRIGVLSIALTDPEPKYFQFASTANNRDEWATYFVRLLPECDHDMDGVPNRLDLDSDNDGCPDAIEGGGTFGYNDLENSEGTVWVGTGSSAGNQNLCAHVSCVDANGIPLVAGPAGQGVGTSQNAAVLDPACYLTITGTVFNDANGNTIINTGENFSSLPVPMYVYLVNSNGIVVDSAHVQSNGTYTLDAASNQNYTIELSTIQYPVGTNTGTTPINNTPPAGWITTGENGTNNSGPGDGNPDGVLSVSVGTTNVDNQNFGIERPPVADAKSYFVANAAFSETPPSGYPDLNTSTLKYFTIPTSSPQLTGYTNNGSLTGKDEEDCPLAESCNTGSRFVLASLYPSTQVVYDFGGETGPRLLVPGDTIPDYDPARLVIYALEGSGIEDPIGFTYSIIDAAGVASPAVSYTILTEAALPVKLLLFTAKSGYSQVTLQWATASEFNNHYFEIQRSTDSKEWTTVGKVTGNGTSALRHDYIFEDRNALNSITYYRLKQVDFDGQFEFSPIRKIEYKAVPEPAKVIWYPNPGNGTITVQSTEGIREVILTDISGRQIVSVSLNSENTRQISFGSIAKGTYLIRFIGNNILQTDKIIIR